MTVAQAFHWFKPDEALAEIQRVLRPGGGLALVWNVRDERDPLQAAVTAIMQPLEEDVPRRHRRDWRQVIDATETATFDHEQLVDEDAFVERFTSVSFVAAAPAEQRVEIEAELRALVRDAARPIRLPYVTEVHLAFKA